jgi:hypothetical protein
MPHNKYGKVFGASSSVPGSSVPEFKCAPTTHKMTTREEITAEFARLRDEARAQIAALREENGTLLTDCKKWDSDYSEYQKIEHEVKKELKSGAYSQRGASVCWLLPGTHTRVGLC